MSLGYLLLMGLLKPNHIKLFRRLLIRIIWNTLKRHFILNSARDAYMQA